MTALLLAALALSLAVNLAQYRRARRSPEPINVVAGVVLPAVDDPDWKRVTEEITWTVHEFDYRTGWRDIKYKGTYPVLVLGGTRVYEPFPSLPAANIQLTTIKIDGDEIGGGSVVAKQYATAVWRAYHSRRALEGVMDSPLLVESSK